MLTLSVCAIEHSSGRSYQADLNIPPANLGIKFSHVLQRGSALISVIQTRGTLSSRTFHRGVYSRSQNYLVEADTIETCHAVRFEPMCLNEFEYVFVF